MPRFRYSYPLIYEELPAIWANHPVNNNVIIEMISSLRVRNNIILTFYVFNYFVASGHEKRVKRSRSFYLLIYEELPAIGANQPANNNVFIEMN